MVLGTGNIKTSKILAIKRNSLVSKTDFSREVIIQRSKGYDRNTNK